MRWRGVAWRVTGECGVAITMARENAHYGVDRLEKLGPGDQRFEGAQH